MADGIIFSIFTKHWKTQSLPELGAAVWKLGFSAIELPVRPGYQINPDNVTKELPAAAKLLKEHNITIASIASDTSEKVIAACGEAGIAINRMQIPIPRDKDYLAAVQNTQREWDKLLPLLEKHKVTLGIQNHCDRFITHAAHLRMALEKYDKRYIAAVWDCAHQAVQGEDPELALDVVWPHLAMVNYKNAFYRRKNAEDAPVAQWERYWTTGRKGLADWTRVAKELKKRNYKGYVCLSAEYHEREKIEAFVAEDLAYMRECFA